MTIGKIFLLTLGLGLVLAGCAVNRVEEVHSAEDAKTIYKLPVVYGIGVAQDSLPLNNGFGALAFAEYDPKTKKGTASCLGSADMMLLRNRPPSPPHELTYHVLMVPPGAYALLGRRTMHEADPSLYFKIEGDRPLYLGDFRIFKPPSTSENAHTNMYGGITTLPVEYHEDAAAEALTRFGISAEGMQKVPLIPDDGWVINLLCTP